MKFSPLLIGLALLAGACSDVADTTAIDELDIDGEPSTTLLLEDPPEVNPDPDNGVSAEDGDPPPDTAAEPAATLPEPLQGTYVASPIASFPHDTEAYTQGLEFVGDRLLESTGLYGESDRRWVDPRTGAVESSVPLDGELFGEGLTVVNGTIVQITWQEEQAIVSDLDLNEVRRFTYRGEGWGLCFDGSRLIMSDGSARLTFRDPDTFEPVGTVEVIRDGEPVQLLNELECVGSQVFANIYTSDEIIVINPETGAVDASIDGSALRPPGLPISDANFALNGIAYRTDTGQFFLTGKLWPVLYEVAFLPS